MFWNFDKFLGKHIFYLKNGITKFLRSGCDKESNRCFANISNAVYSLAFMSGNSFSKNSSQKFSCHFSQIIFQQVSATHRLKFVSRIFFHFSLQNFYPQSPRKRPWNVNNWSLWTKNRNILFIYFFKQCIPGF